MAREPDRGKAAEDGRSEAGSAPVRSMTGFGSGEQQSAAHRIHVEIRGVNHRHLTWKAKLPSYLYSLEPLADVLIRRYVSRGSLVVSVDCEAFKREPQIRIHRELAEHYLRELRDLSEKLGLQSEPRLDFLLHLPGVMEVTEDETSAPEVRDLFLRVLEEALISLVASREREGRALADEILARAARLVSMITDVAKVWPTVIEEYRARLKQRVVDFLAEQGHTMQDVDVLREVALMAEKTDVAEETSRLSTHLVEMKRIVTRGGSMGRHLDFLSQEMLREANTVASKSTNARLAQQMIEVKAELERIKEQAQNLE